MISRRSRFASKLVVSEKKPCRVILPPEPFDFKQPCEPPVVFMAGAIDQGKASRWDLKVIDFLKDTPCVLLNPRRENWDASWEQSIDNRQFKEQVEWELKGLEQASFVILCLPSDSKAPISLLELGLHVIGRRMIVFCGDEYWRKGNVDVVCNRYGVPVYTDFDSFLVSIKARILETSCGTHVEEVLPEGTLRDHKSKFVTACERVCFKELAYRFVKGFRTASLINLVKGKTYRVLRNGASLFWEVPVPNGWTFDGVKLNIGDEIIYKGLEMGWGEDNVRQPVFSLIGRGRNSTGKFSPNFWGKIDSGWLEEV